MLRVISVFLVLCALSFSAVCGGVVFTDCGSTVGKFTSVSVSGCDMSKSACELVRDTNATIEIQFTTDKDISLVNAVVHGVIMDMEIPFPLPNANACENHSTGITCPLQMGGPYTYRATLPILKNYPKLSVTVKWQLQDEANENMVCVYIPTKIT